MNIDQPFYIFSVELDTLGLQENGSRTAFVGSMLRKQGIPFTVVKGKYNGHEERAFLVMDSDYGKPGTLRDTVMRLIELYKQESYLYVDANRKAALYNYLGGRIREAGTWHEVKPDSVGPCDDVTITPDDRMWVAA